jgi:hypothetical protein
MSSHQIYAEQELSLRSRTILEQADQFTSNAKTSFSWNLPNLSNFTVNSKRILTIDDLGGIGGATVQVGTTTTLPAGNPATVTNSGTLANAVFNFAIPQGPAGINGTNGTNGTDGTSAPPGVFSPFIGLMRWADNQVQSSIADGAIITGGWNIVFESTGSFNAAAGRWTAPVDGYYSISIRLYSEGGSGLRTVLRRNTAEFFQNGGFDCGSGCGHVIDVMMLLYAGDIIDVINNDGVTKNFFGRPFNTSASGAGAIFSVQRIS